MTNPSSLNASPILPFLTAVTLAALFALIVSACGGGEEPKADTPPCQDGSCEECTPLTCDELGAQCGEADDGCGGVLACGNCPASQACGLDAPNVCDFACGNGFLDPGEACDDGNRSTDDCEYGEDYYCQVCDRHCQLGAGKLQFCGDQFVQKEFGEECDDNNDVDWDGCDNCLANPCQFQEIHSSEQPEAGSIVVRGDRLYLADDKAIEIYDISAPSSMTQVATYSDGGNSRFVEMALAGSHLLVSGRGATLRVYSLANPDAPVLVGEAADRIIPGPIAVDGNVAYVAGYLTINGEIARGIVVLDISNPAAPVELGVVQSPNLYATYSILAKGSIVYVGGTNGVHFFDVSTPTAPQFLGNFDPEPDDIWSTDIRGMQRRGNTLLTNGYGSKLAVLDVSDHTAPTLLSSKEGESNAAGPMMHWNDDVYVVASYPGLFAHSISTSHFNPTLGGAVAELTRQMARKGDVIFATANNDGIGGSNHYLKAFQLTCQ